MGSRSEREKARPPRTVRVCGGEGMSTAIDRFLACHVQKMFDNDVKFDIDVKNDLSWRLDSAGVSARRQRR